MADTNERYELAKLIDDIIDCAVHAGACDARKGFGAFTESDSMSMTAMRRSISQKRAQIIGHFDESNATPPADAALAENAAIECLRACAQAMRIFDRPDTASEVDRATDAIAAALRARAVPQSAPAGFVEWLCQEMPPGTVISDPAWWAPKIHRAMLAASKEAGK